MTRVVPAQAGIPGDWSMVPLPTGVPAFAGMTVMRAAEFSA